MAADFAETVRMAALTERAFNVEYCKRVRALREARGYSQEQMADTLGIPPDRYRKYEGRSPLPVYLVPRFALIVGRDVEYAEAGKARWRLNLDPPPRLTCKADLADPCRRPSLPP